MKNNNIFLKLVMFVILSACGPTIELVQSDIAEKLEKTSKNTKFFKNKVLDLNLENKENKWQYVLYDPNTEKELVHFDVDDFRRNGEFDISKVKTYKVETDNNGTKNIENFDVSIKLPKTNLTYGHYGFIEKKGEICNKFTGACDEKEYSIPFYLGYKDKLTNFEIPMEEIKFTGTTYAKLQTTNRNDYINGTATLKLSANSLKGDIVFNYNDNLVKNVKAKGVDFSQDSYGLPIWKVDEWSLNDKKIEGFNKEILANIFGEKEILGRYELKNEDITLNGAFGMKKQ